ncbi:MAG TPA: helix-turn-helix domain-containing protein, partial [Candidatus Limnocylindria bacterium]
STGAREPTPTLLSDQQGRGPHRIGPRVNQRHSFASEESPAMISNEVGKLLTATEVAEMLHLHVNTVKRLGDRGEIPFYRVCKRGDRRFRYDDVVSFLHRPK